MFYTQFKKLCAERDVKPSAVCRTLGFSPSSPARWKDGTIPSSIKLQKIAEYFEVTTDYLLYGDNPPTYNTTGDVSHSALVQGNSGSNLSATYSSGGDLQGFEGEILRIYRELDMKGKASLLQAAYALEEALQK